MRARVRLALWAAAATPAIAPAARVAAAPHQTDPLLAAALFAAWSGDPAVVVASPPGAGKTRLVIQLCPAAPHARVPAGRPSRPRHARRRSKSSIAPRPAGARVALLGVRDSRRPVDLHPQAGYLAGAAQLGRWKGIAVATSARWLWVNERDYTAHVCVLDEAWQMTFADLGGLDPLSEQVVLVGDPGQIAPVVTGDARRWEGWPAGPQQAAPDALVAAYAGSVTRLRLDRTWRLGPRTTALIQPAFYADLPFSSARPPRYVVLRDQVQPELVVRLVSPLAGPGDQRISAATAERVRELVSGGTVVDGDVPGESHRLAPQDVAAITPHVEEASAVAARLADMPGVLIGTANQAQGLEREAVVVIHPLACYREAPAFATDPGRLCVALSRHRAHATVILDAATNAVLQHALAEMPDDTALSVQRYVLSALLNLS